ncbi:MAG: efflux RND transporter periplasmic adaptor subunit [Planctomycetota bacterium]|nr:efflux RND transporter periplasmic adaptor subunit [Planctomycetota bacterium]
MSVKRTRARITLLSAALVAVGLCLTAPGCSDDRHDGHEDHDDHEGHAGHDGHDDDEGSAGHEGHAGEDRVQLTPTQREQIGLRVAEAGPGTLHARAAFPGEIVVSPDRLAHIVPRASGIVRQVTKSLGDQVEAEETLAWLESAALGEAKLKFFAKQSEARIYSLDLPRARLIHKHTLSLLAVLEKMPSVEELHAVRPQEVGEYHGRLISAYADFVFSKKAYAREKTLYAKKISSEGDLIHAESAFEKAQADYLAARDTIPFEAMRKVIDTARKQQVAEFEAAAAAQNLRILGLSDTDIRALDALVPKALLQDPAAAESDLAARLKQERKLAWYPLRAPFAGTILEKHITLGEKLGDDAQAFTIADLSQVWVQFNVYQKDLLLVRAGQRTRIEAGIGIANGAGVVAYVAPLVEEVSRTAVARVVLENPDGRWRPGLFVTVHVDAGSFEAAVVVPRTAVQTLGQRQVVFIEEDGAFEPVTVTLGRTSDGSVEIIEGLEKGQRYVVKGAFDLKAKIVTSSMGSHAGHGH